MLRIDEQFVFDQVAELDMEEINQAVVLIEEYREQEWYEAKAEIIAKWEIDHTRIYEFIISVFTAAMTNESITMQAIVGMMNHKIKLDDEIERVKITADLIGLISQTGLIDFESAQGEYHYITTEYEFDEEIPTERKHAPVLIRPEPVETNWDYNNGRGSVILGHRMNHHEEDVRLSHINRLNRIDFKLDPDFIDGFLEAAKEMDFEDQESVDAWELFATKSQESYEEIIASGNKFNTPHNYCSRGRTYAGSYYTGYQGSSFKKAIVQLFDEEIVTR